jgi:PAS domain S-box-containing protein
MNTGRMRQGELSSESKARFVAFWFASVCSILVWMFSKQLTIVFVYIPGHEMRDMVLLGRVEILIAAALTGIFFLFAYGASVQYELYRKKKTVSLSKEAVSDLMLSREQFRKLYENSPVPYFLMDDAGNIRNPNRAALRFFGGTLEDCGSANFYTLLTGEENTEKMIEFLRAKVERAIPITQEELSVQTLNKKESRHALVSIYSLEKQSTVSFKHLVTLVDVSKERENERAKTDFLLLASHQLRTPLTTIKWYIDYLFSADKLEMPKIVRDYLEQIYIGNQRMIELMTTLLTISKIEMGTLAPQYEKIHLNEVVKDVLNELATDIRKKIITVDIQTKGDDLLTTDRAMVRIVIQNLLTNAIKYTYGNGKITILSNYGPHSCLITVSDSGCGIPMQEQEKIFSKMFRATNARKMSAGGTGLGLFMSRAFIQKLGGDLNFTSEEGKGSSFIITLPRVAPDA